MSQSDDYAREVLRDAIPLLEQLLERLKVIANTQRVVVDPRYECVKRLRAFGIAEVQSIWGGDDRYRFDCDFDICKQAAIMAVTFCDTSATSYRIGTDLCPIRRAVTHPELAERQIRTLVAKFNAGVENQCQS